MENVKGKLEEVVFETPDPPSSTQPDSPARSYPSEGIDTSPSSTQAAFQKFRESEDANGHSASLPRKARSGYEVGKKGNFEPPEQRLMRLQAEVAELMALSEKAAKTKEAEAAIEYLGADAAEMTSELKVLEQRLAGLAKEGSMNQQGLTGKASVVGAAMTGSLVSSLERLATGKAVPKSSAEGQVTYEISYVPSTAAIADSAKIAAMESSIADLERQLGVMDPSNPFPDLQTAVAQLQKRVALLDRAKLDLVSKGVDKVLREMEQVLAKKAELDGGSKGEDRKEQDQKVRQLYEFCHRWSATASSLPAIVARLHSLQALHLQSSSFAARLEALEQQQEELHKLLESTSAAVQDLSKGLQENMAIVRDNMQSLEAKIVKAVRP
mmetsp:Transcript_59671/g.106064  ORF Transcript_59671/g.106064 Transcript_59671/m.106064 type:complete len:383 (+) Transcript_59671:44-1192(+)